MEKLRSIDALQVSERDEDAFRSLCAKMKNLPCGFLHIAFPKTVWESD